MIFTCYRLRLLCCSLKIIYLNEEDRHKKTKRRHKTYLCLSIHIYTYMSTGTNMYMCIYEYNFRRQKLIVLPPWLGDHCFNHTKMQCLLWVFPPSPVSFHLNQVKLISPSTHKLLKIFPHVFGPATGFFRIFQFQNSILLNNNNRKKTRQKRKNI